MREVAKQRFVHLDFLRFVAIALVFLMHLGLDKYIPGGAGVTIFFVISGFIISYLNLKQGKKETFDIKEFALKRAFKILPPLFLLVLLPGFIYMQWHPEATSQFIGQVFFYYNSYRSVENALVLPGTGVVWSLSIEEQFYVAFPIFLALVWTSKHRNRWIFSLSVIAIAMSTSYRVFNYVNFADPQWLNYFSTLARIDSIAFGVALGVLYSEPRTRAWLDAISLRSWRFSGLLATLVFATSSMIAIPMFANIFLHTVQSVCAAIVIAYGLFEVNESRVLKFMNFAPFQLLGRISYPFYLVHFTVILSLKAALDTFSPLLAICLAFPISFTIALLTHKWIEIPSLKLRDRLLREN